MSEHPTAPADQPESASGEEPEEESGAGYGNHAADGPEQANKGDADEQ